MEDDSPTIDMEAVRAMAAKRAEGCHAIGKFLFEFSQLEFNIRAALSGRLNLREGLFDVVTSPYDFTALCTVMMKVSIAEHPDRGEEISKLYKRCKELNTDRVRVAHGLWTESHSGLMVRHVSRGTLEATYHFEDPSELHRLASTAQLLVQEVMGFGGS